MDFIQSNLIINSYSKILENSVSQYPYVPAHVTKPKELRKLFLVQLGEKGKNAEYMYSMQSCSCQPV